MIRSSGCQNAVLAFCPDLWYTDTGNFFLKSCYLFKNLSFLCVRTVRRAVKIVEDQAIIALFEQRNEQAISASEQQYGSLCRSVAHDITGSTEDAEECLNDALFTVWNSIPPSKPRNLCAYLLRLVRNAALDRYRSVHAAKRGASHYSGSLDELAEIIPDGSDTVSDLERREMLSAVTAFLKELPQKQRDLFVRRYWYSSDIGTLSELFDMSEGNVKMTLSRLRKRLKNYLEKEGLL